MKTNNKNEFTARANAIIKAYGELLTIWAAVVETAKEMDGKVFNKRFSDAINAKTEKTAGRVSFSDPYNLGHKNMDLFVNSRCYQAPGVCGWSYIDDELYSKWLQDAGDLLTDGRIDAEKVANVAGRMVETINNKVAILKDGVKTYDKQRAAVAKALRALGVSFAKINPLFVPSGLTSFDWEKAAKEAL